MYILICQLNSQEKVKTEQTTGNKQRKGLYHQFIHGIQQGILICKTDAKQVINQFSIQNNDIIVVLFDKPLNRAEFPLHEFPWHEGIITGLLKTSSVSDVFG